MKVVKKEEMLGDALKIETFEPSDEQKIERERIKNNKSENEQNKINAEKQKRYRDKAKNAKLEKEQAELLKKNEELLRDAIAPTLELLTDTIHTFALDGDDPTFGNERAKQCSAMWAKVFAPYLDEDAAKKLLPLLASGMTAGHLMAWAQEVRKYRAEKDKDKSPASSAPVVRVEQPKHEKLEIAQPTAI